MAAAGFIAASVWPRTADASLRRTLDALRASPVPVLVALPDVPRDTQAQTDHAGYTYTLVGPGGNLVVHGSRTPPSSPPAPDELRWTDAGVSYSLTAPGARDDPAGTRARLVPLDDALRQRWGFLPDTPLLYAGYLSVFVAFLVYAGWSVLGAERRG